MKRTAATKPPDELPMKSEDFDRMMRNAFGVPLDPPPATKRKPAKKAAAKKRAR